MVFSGVSGSAVADASAIGSALIPSMKQRGYPAAYAAAVVAAASTMGPIIPPSIAFVVYALVSEVSIGKLFLAGAVPGVLMGVYLLVTAEHRGAAAQLPLLRAGVAARASATRFGAALPALAMPVIILGGIVAGVTTPTEAGVVAVLYADRRRPLPVPRADLATDRAHHAGVDDQLRADPADDRRGRHLLVARRQPGDRRDARQDAAGAHRRHAG